MRNMLLAAALLALATPTKADVIYHFTPDPGQPQMYAQIDFRSTAPVSGTAPWTLSADGVHEFLPLMEVTLYQVPALPMAGVPAMSGVSYDDFWGTLSSSTGATIDGGTMLGMFPPHYEDAEFTFGPGGVGLIRIGAVYNQAGGAEEFAFVSGVWSFGPAPLVPEPSGAVLLGLGVLGVLGSRQLARRRGRDR